MKIIGISGSLRHDSFNTKLLTAAGQQLPETTDFRILSCDLPLYNQELEGDALPDSVAAFKTAIADADGLLISSPEYNHSFSGVIKNAIDWASRPAFESPLKHKPVALLSASPSPIGGARAQLQLRSVLASTLSVQYPAIDFVLPSAMNAFDDQGQLADETALKRLHRFANGFIDWIQDESIS